MVMIACFSFEAMAADVNNDAFVDIHGFMTTGATVGDNKYMYSNGISKRLNYLYDSQFGLNLSKRLNAQWDFAAQYISNFSDTGRIFNVDWVLASYYPIKGLSFQIGKHKMPVWLISDHSGVGKVYPWVRPPQEVYVLDPVQRFIGAKATYEYVVGDGSLALSVYGGGVQGSLSTLAGRTVTRSTFNGYDIRGATLSFEYDALTVRSSYMEALVSFSAPNYQIDKLTLRYFTTGMKFDWWKILFYAEYVKTGSEIPKSEIEAGDLAVKNAIGPAAILNALVESQILHSKFLDTRSYYATLGYRITEDLMFAVTYAKIKSSDQNLGQGSQNSRIAGLKYDFNRWADLKIEYQRTEIEEGSSGLYTIDFSTPYTALAKRLNILNLAMDFIF